MEQFDFITEKIQTIKRKMKLQQQQIDSMERKMLTTIKKRNEKEQLAIM